MNISIKHLVISRYKDKYSIVDMCKFFEVSRSGYYDFIKRAGNPDKDSFLVQCISECQARTNKTYGYRRVCLYLDRQGIKANHKAVLRIMNKYGLLSEIRRRKKYRRMSEQLHKYENILNRDFNAESPNTKWVTDISYIHSAQGVLYLSMIRDLYDGSIISYRTGTEQTVHLVLNTIKDAMKKEKVTKELQLHSDQGLQYTSTGYFNLTKEYGITPSMSRRGNCYDNAVAENFFGILKTECIYRYKPKTFDDVRQLIDHFIWFYNNERIQLKTKLTPLEKRRQFA